jgi:hypothetical protein
MQRTLIIQTQSPRNHHHIGEKEPIKQQTLFPNPINELHGNHHPNTPIKNSKTRRRKQRIR